MCIRDSLHWYKELFLSEGKLRKPRGTAFYLYNAIIFIYIWESCISWSSSTTCKFVCSFYFIPPNMSCTTVQCHELHHINRNHSEFLNIEKCSQNTSDSWTDTSMRRRWCRSCFYSPALVEAEGLTSIFAAHREYHLELSLFFESLSLINIAAFCCCIASSEKTYKKFQCAYQPSWSL